MLERPMAASMVALEMVARRLLSLLFLVERLTRDAWGV